MLQGALTVQGLSWVPLACLAQHAVQCPLVFPRISVCLSAMDAHDGCWRVLQAK